MALQKDVNKKGKKKKEKKLKLFELQHVITLSVSNSVFSQAPGHEALQEEARKHVALPCINIEVRFPKNSIFIAKPTGKSLH